MTPVVPLADPTRLDPAESAAIRAAIDDVVRHGPWVGGPAVERFEREFAAYLGRGEVIGCGNGTDALTLALVALELPAGSAVLVAANEGGYAATAARMAGLVPVAMDVDRDTMAPTVATASTAATAAVRAVVVTHLHGDPVPLADLDAWRRDRGLALIEDCAQAHGARAAGDHVGLTGDAGTFSFYPTKNLGAVGDAGAVVTADPALAGRVRSAAQYGWDPRPVIAHPGGRNSRLDPLQAAVLSSRLPHLPARNARRRAIWAHYRSAAPALDLAGDPKHGVAHHTVVRSAHREDLIAHLDARGINSAVHFPAVVGDLPGLAMASGASTPVARRLAREVLSVPCAPELTDTEVERVTDALVAWSRR